MPDLQEKPIGEVKTEEQGAMEQAAVSESAAAALPDEEKSKALSWFLADPPPEGARSSFRLNVSEDPAEKNWIQWTVRALPRERITEIRNEEAEGTIGLGKGNLRIATEGTKYPSLKDNRGNYADPADALATRFAFKPGLIDQIASRVIACSGYDEEDVKELSAVKT